MRSLNDFFDKIYCIHVDGYDDRLNCIHNVEKQLNCEIEIFNAYTPDMCDIPTNPPPRLNTEYACATSHIKLWEHIQHDNPVRPLILEDDVVVNSDIDIFQLLDDVCDQLLSDTTDIAFLGINYRLDTRFHQLTDKLLKVNRAYTTHSYSPTTSMINELLQTINMTELYNNPKPIDGEMCRMYPLYNVIAIKPPIFYQQTGISIIQNNYVNYDSWLK